MRGECRTAFAFAGLWGTCTAISVLLRSPFWFLGQIACWHVNKKHKFHLWRRGWVLRCWSTVGCSLPMLCDGEASPLGPDIKELAWYLQSRKCHTNTCSKISSTLGLFVELDVISWVLLSVCASWIWECNNNRCHYPSSFVNVRVQVLWKQFSTVNFQGYL